MTAVILAIETAGATASLALGTPDGVVLASARCDVARRHAEFVAPALAALLDGVGVDAADLEAVVVDRGPGQYTGLRVGLATAGALHVATDVPVLGVSSLATLAVGASGRVATLVDMRRGEFALAIFDAGSLEPAAPPRLVAATEAVEHARAEQVTEVRADVALPGAAHRPLDARDLLRAGLALRAAGAPADATPLYLRDVDAKLWHG